MRSVLFLENSRVRFNSFLRLLTCEYINHRQRDFYWFLFRRRKMHNRCQVERTLTFVFGAQQKSFGALVSLKYRKTNEDQSSLFS